MARALQTCTRGQRDDVRGQRRGRRAVRDREAGEGRRDGDHLSRVRQEIRRPRRAQDGEAAEPRAVALRVRDAPRPHDRAPVRRRLRRGRADERRRVPRARVARRRGSLGASRARPALVARSARGDPSRRARSLPAPRGRRRPPRSQAGERLLVRSTRRPREAPRLRRRAADPPPEEHEEDHTATGISVGTPLYMAPEQIVAVASRR